MRCRGMVCEKVYVCLPRNGNGTGRWEATWLTRPDGITRFFGGTERDGIGERVVNKSYISKYICIVGLVGGLTSVGGLVIVCVGWMKLIIYCLELFMM